MGIWNFLMEKEQKNESVEERNYPASLNIALHGILSGVSDDYHTAEQLLSIPVAKACTDLIVNSIKTLPIELYERIDNDTVKEVTDDYRLRLLNREPNTIATGTDFKAKLMQDLLLHGNAYVEIERDGNEITSLWNLDASYVGISKYGDKAIVIKNQKQLNSYIQSISK